MKHCTTDKCPQILDSSCVFYEGASLIFSGINTNDSVETVIQKLNLKLESFPGINLNNYYKKTETYSQTQIDNIVSDLELEIDNKVNSSDVYLKTQTYSQTEINGFLSGKQNTIGYTPENVANKSDSYTASSSTTYASTKALVDGLSTKLDKGINHTWSPTNRTLTLFDSNGTQLSQVSLVSLDNEGTDIRYNASTLSLELYNADNELLDSIPVSSFIGSVGTQLQLNSNQLQLRDSQGNVLSTVAFSISNVQGLQAALDSKLNKPTSTGNTTSHPFVVGEDGNGNSARLPAGDLGKNFFNSDLSNTTARNHTMNAGVTVNTLGNPHTLSGLPNKNADIVNFRKVRVQNASGLDAVVDSKNILIDMPSQLSDTEKTSWKTQMNGGWTTATMSVSSILPPFIDKSKNYSTFITLNGANLNLNPASFSVEILDLSNNVVVTIPNSQVQLNNVGTSITFYYNFNSIPLGNYKIRLWNGVAYYTSSLTLNVVSTLNNIDLSSAVWQKQELESGKLTTSNNSLTGNLKSTTNLLTTPFLAGLLNIPNLTLNDDFIISCTFLGLGGNPIDAIINAAFGLSTSSNITGIVNAVSYGVNVRQYQNKASAAIVGGSGQTAPLNTSQNLSFAFDLIISKSGNILNIAILNPNSGSPVISTVTITPSSQPISLAFFSECNGNAAYATSFNTVNVIKIN